MSVTRLIRDRFRVTDKRTYFKSNDPEAITAYVTYDVSEIPRGGKFKASFAPELDEHGRTEITIVVYEQ